MNDGILHERGERRQWLSGGRVVSPLDIYILGGGTATCEKCGRWQSFSALTPMMAQEQLARYGWAFTNGELCPKCAMINARDTPDVVSLQDAGQAVAERSQMKSLSNADARNRNAITAFNPEGVGRERLYTRAEVLSLGVDETELDALG